ncbi:MAG: hypothetical protein ACYCSX_15480, partial [Acidimicrobiales bacterium]
MTTRTRRQSTRTVILNQFPSDIADRLLRFYDDLADLDTDAVMFMARKSYCLYNVMRKAGARAAGPVVLSDRILDFDLSKLEGRRITIVDDTLFLGSTLDRTRRQLLNAGVADVNSRVFCRNTDWHDGRIFDPDVVALDLDDRATRAFCSAALRALSVAPRPYNVDFPVYRAERSNTRELNELLSSNYWDAVNLTSPHQRTAGTGIHTFFPDSITRERFRTIVGDAIADVVDVEKIRLYVRFSDRQDLAWLSVLPIVLFKPIDDRLTKHALNLIAEKADLGDLLASMESPRARLRYLQYWVSNALGALFLGDAGASIGRPLRGDVDDEEACHHFGPWNAACLRRGMVLARDSAEGQWSIAAASAGAQMESSLRAADSLPADLRKAVAATQPGSPSLADDVVADFGHLFVSMYDLRELPARRAALAAIDRPTFPDVGRLDQGIPFHVLEDFLSTRHNLRQASRQDVARILSLILDVCNDHGIAVPITCVTGDHVFRAYRHGEDVKFADGEVDLAFYAVKGFMDASERETIPNLTLQKLLVLLIRVGAARGFLEVLHGENSVSNIVDIQFDLKGAVPKIHTGPRRRADSEEWLVQYLRRRGVLERKGSQGPIRLGRPVDGSFLVADAPQQAQELGAMLGLLSKPSAEYPTLSARELTILASV